VASGLAGPRRAYSGSVRDFILGARFVNGKGEIVTAGGKVMKNVAGFDLFRPMARSMGTLGVLLQVALRVLPQPEFEKTILHEESNESVVLKKMSLWTSKTQSVSAAAWDGHNIRIRLSGSAASIEHGWKHIGGEILTEDIYWQDLNNFNLNFFKQQGRLWRVSVAPMSGPIGEDMAQLVDWGGSQRWLKGDRSPETVRSRASRHGGHAECFSEDQTIPTYHPLGDALQAANQRFKDALDPAGILNPGRFW
jgi:glycolate oxidase FAD binding subunit